MTYLAPSNPDEFIEGVKGADHLLSNDIQQSIRYPDDFDNVLAI
jgi:hypothetical protein